MNAIFEEAMRQRLDHDVRQHVKKRREKIAKRIKKDGWQSITEEDRTYLPTEARVLLDIAELVAPIVDDTLAKVASIDASLKSIDANLRAMVEAGASK